MRYPVPAPDHINKLITSLPAAPAIPARSAAAARAAPSESQDFLTWFGESKIVDASGAPLVVYHGTGQDFESFKGPIYLTAHAGQASDYARNSAEAYGGAARVIPVYASLRNPAVVDDDYIEWAGYEKAEIDRLLALGHDGMMNVAMTEIVAFRPEQIKSAIGSGLRIDPPSTSVPAAPAQDMAAGAGIHANDQATSAPPHPIQSHEFRRWFGESAVVDGNGAPLVVYHGTLAEQDFSEFSSSDFFGSGMFGSGINFTSSPADASKYASPDVGINHDIGPKAERLAAKIAGENGGDRFRNIYMRVKRVLTAGGGRILPVYLSMKKPLVLAGEKLSVLEHVFMLAAAECDIQGDKAEGLYRRFMAAKDGIAQFDQLYAASATTVYRQIATLLNRDGIIVRPPLAPKSADGSHYIVFRPEQIKSAIGNSGRFDPANADITDSHASPSLAAAAGDLTPAPGQPAHQPSPPAAAQARPTVTDAFRIWFGKSKVVSEDGAPLVVYHGTKSDFSAFDLKKFGASDEGLTGKGFYFTYNPVEASGYAESEVWGKGDAPNVMPVYVALQNPFIIKGGVLPDGRKVSDLQPGVGITSKGGSAIRKLADDGGHDGMLWLRHDGGVGHVVAFRPEQIKSAIGNSGRFDPQNADIADASESLRLVAGAGKQPGSQRQLAHQPTPPAPAFTHPTETVTFRTWFGNSKAVGANGAPLVVYHGTAGDFKAFDSAKSTTASMHATAYLGHYFTESPEVANEFVPQSKDMSTWPRVRGPRTGGNVMPVYLAVCNPYVMPLSDFRAMVPKGRSKEGIDQARALRKQLKSEGYDGIFIAGDPSLKDSMGGDEWHAGTWIVFRPEQIKSVIGNSGRFDPTNADITDSQPSLILAAGAGSPADHGHHEQPSNQPTRPRMRA